MNDTRALRRWMLIVGWLYILMGIRLVPAINGAMIEAVGLETLYFGGDLTVEMDAYRWTLDWMATFGASVFVAGLIAVIAAREPQRNRLVAWLLIAHEAIAGIVDDVWMLSRDYLGGGVYWGWIAFHTIVIVTGVWALRRAAGAPPAHRREHATTAA